MTLFIFLLSVIFTYFNYSFFAWNIFNNIGGLALAKIGPELFGIVVYLYLALVTFRKLKSRKGIFLSKQDFFIIALLLILTILPRFKEFNLYFYADDFYFWFNREGTSYSVYKWGRWLSSHPGWVWELTRLIGGFNPVFYQITSLFSHFLFGTGVYFLAKYLSKDRLVGFFSSVFFLTTTIHFETFQWLSHVSNFGWQGLLMTLSLLALIWQADEDKGEDLPYLSSFLMMAALFAGTARTGAILPILSIVDIVLIFRIHRRKNIFLLIKKTIKRQWVFYLPVVVFIWTRDLFVSGSPRYEAVSDSLMKIFLWLTGVFTIPPEVIKFFSYISPYWLGSFTIIFGAIFVAMMMVFIAWNLIIKGKNLLYFFIAFIWVFFFSFYYTLFGPHVPVTTEALRLRTGSHHLAYPSSVGISLVVGLVSTWILGILFSCLNARFGRKRAVFWCLVICLIPVLILSRNLNREYSKFLYLPYSRQIVREKFFFDSYRKHIPTNALEINIFYDNDYLNNKWNFVPPAEYFRAFWPESTVKVIKGQAELMNFVDGALTKDRLNEKLRSLYSIKIDFEFPTSEDKSEELRNDILRGRY